MKKSLLIIAALFLVQFGYSQNHPYQSNSNYGNNGHNSYHGNHVTCNNSNSNYSPSHVVACCTFDRRYPIRPNCGNHHGNRFMTNQELNAVIHAIRNESFSSDKLAVARQAVLFQNVRANQVVEIGNLFSFESDRLEFAKMAYKNTVDKHNYYLVNSIFHFSSSKRELNNFIFS